jgi:hypothetical protein
MSTLDLPFSARLLASLFNIEQAAQCGVCFSRLPHFARRRCFNSRDWGLPAMLSNVLVASNGTSTRCRYWQHLRIIGKIPQTVFPNTDTAASLASNWFH